MTWWSGLFNQQTELSWLRRRIQVIKSLANTSCWRQIGYTARRPNPRWTQTEDETLLKLREVGKTFKQIASQIPGKDRNSAISRYHKNLKKGQVELKPIDSTASKPGPPWTDVEDEIILKGRLEGKDWVQVASQLPGRTRITVKNRYHGVLRKRRADSSRSRFKRFAELEDEMIKSMRESGATWKAIQQRMPHRPIGSIFIRYKQYLQRPEAYQRRQWSEDETLKLCRLRDVSKLPWADIAKALRRTEKSVSSRYQKATPFSAKLRIRRRDELTDEEFNTIRRLRVAGKSYASIGKELGRAVATAYHNYHMPDVLRAAVPSGRYYTPADDAQILALRQQGASWVDIASALSPIRSTNSVVDRWNLLKERERLAQMSSLKDVGDADTKTTTPR